MAQQVKDPDLPQLWRRSKLRLRCDPWQLPYARGVSSLQKRRRTQMVHPFLPVFTCYLTLTQVKTQQPLKILLFFLFPSHIQVQLHAHITGQTQPLPSLSRAQLEPFQQLPNSILDRCINLVFSPGQRGPKHRTLGLTASFWVPSAAIGLQQII